MPEQRKPALEIMTARPPAASLFATEVPAGMGFARSGLPPEMRAMAGHSILQAGVVGPVPRTRGLVFEASTTSPRSSRLKLAEAELRHTGAATSPPTVSERGLGTLITRSQQLSSRLDDGFGLLDFFFRSLQFLFGSCQLFLERRSF